MFFMSNPNGIAGVHRALPASRRAGGSDIVHWKRKIPMATASPGLKTPREEAAAPALSAAAAGRGSQAREYARFVDDLKIAAGCLRKAARGVTPYAASVFSTSLIQYEVP
jgi:hypothetical protein